MINKTKIAEILNSVLKIDLQESEYETPLIDKGFDSLHFIRFILLIEETCNIEVLDSDLLYENFGTVNKICETLKNYDKQDN